MDTMPLIGLGTWKLQGAECEKIVHEAVTLGYSHIDTADCYENHAAIGRALRPFPREKIYLTTKIWPTDLSPKGIKAAASTFLQDLQTDYIDLLLIHWPVEDLDKIRLALDTLVELQHTRVIRHIGVSNFDLSHLPLLTNYPIATNQIELHPYFQQKELVEAYVDHHIPITAYRPLAKGAFSEDPTLQKIGKRYNKTPSQIVLRWLTEQNIAVIPKASSAQHLLENLHIQDFTLSKEDRAEILGLDRNQRYCSVKSFS